MSVSASYLSPGSARHARRRGGFLLLEVTIAAAIFAISIVGLCLALNHILDAQTLSFKEQELRTELETRLASARIAQVEENTIDLEPDSYGRKYRQEMKRVELHNQDDVELVGIWQISVTAFDPSGKEPIDSASIYVYRP
jgi:type II secretory pathway pseudopilin PulG